jgi:hypothetical protein
LQPIFAAIELIAAHCEACSPSCSNTIRTARSWTSGAYLGDACFVMMTPVSQEMGSPVNPVRFKVVTVISGTFKLGSGEIAEKDKARPLSAGSFFAFSPGMMHFAYTDEETVVQVSSTGPWGLRYVNPQDDPRQKTQ